MTLNIKDDIAKPMRAARKTRVQRRKRPLSGFVKFSQAHRSTVKKEHPEMAFGEVGKKLGEMWRELSDEEKQLYKPAAANTA